jgi:hypothetical protein
VNVGQKIIYKGDMANASGQGAIVAIRNHSMAGTSYTMNWKSGQLEPFDSSKSFDVALDDGRKFNAVMIANIGGEFSNKSKRFMLDEGMENADGIAALIASVEAREIDLKQKAAEAAAIFKAAQEAAKVAGLKLGLIPQADFTKRGSAAAYNLRLELKAAGIKASVNNKSSINVTLQKDASDEQVQIAKQIGSKYKAGSFDGMTDCYDYDPSAWGTVFGDSDYVFVQRDWQ